MLPVLLSIGPIIISSFGFFLSLSVVFSFFLVWRLLRAWDLPEERILDLFLLTFFGSLAGARIFFIEQNFDSLGWDVGKWFLIMKYPGLNFWGAFLGGWLALFFFARKLKEDFWQIADLFAPGFLLALILGDVGCLLGGCFAGVPSSLPLSVNLVGVVGSRFPVQALEAVFLLILLANIWPMAKKFHFRGKIISLTLIFTGLLRFTMTSLSSNSFSDDVLSFILFLLGLLIYYKAGKKNPLDDLKALKNWGEILAGLKKAWYNKKIVWKLNLKKMWQFAKRRLNVKFAPRNVQ